MPFPPMTLSYPCRRTIVQGLVGLALLPSARSANAQLSLPTAVNRAARFRALSQRTEKWPRKSEQRDKWKLRA